MTYDTFEAWFDELESFSLRSERFLVDAERNKPDSIMIEWLRAAFEAGREGSDVSKTGVGKTGDADSESRIKKLAEIIKYFKKIIMLPFHCSHQKPKIFMKLLWTERMSLFPAISIKN